MKIFLILSIIFISLFFTACDEDSSSDDIAGFDSAVLILIYNNVSQDGVDNFAQNAVGGEGTFSQYNKDENIHCSDFGYTNIATQGTSGGYYTIIYRDGTKQCSETDGSASEYSGDKNVAFYR